MGLRTFARCGRVRTEQIDETTVAAITASTIDSARAAERVAGVVDETRSCKNQL